MKTISEVINQSPVYLNNWEDKIDVIGDFEDIFLSGKEYRAKDAPYANEKYWAEKVGLMRDAEKRYEGINILFASYGTGNYEGDAFVLYEQEGKLYEVNGSHCSCYGLEGQWEGELTTLESLSYRLTEGTLGIDAYSSNDFNKELRDFLGV